MAGWLYGLIPDTPGSLPGRWRLPDEALFAFRLPPSAFYTRFLIDTFN